MISIKKNRLNTKRIYLDNAAATPVDPDVLKEMNTFEREVFGNPSALHDEGLEARRVLDRSRESIASIIHAKSEQIIFTGSGTEANALAILGAARYARKEHGKDHVVLSAIEHPSGIECGEALRREGFSVEYASVSSEGLVDTKELKKMLKPETALVSVIYANNEIGTIQPAREVAKILRGFRKTQKTEDGVPSVFPLFHIDACQAVNYLEVNVQKLGVDLMSWNSSKIYGPKGVGALYVAPRADLEPLVYGGGQEKNLRSGTEDVARILGFSLAMEKAEEIKEKESARIIKLRDEFIQKTRAEIPEVILNGSEEERLPNNVNFSFPGKDAEEVVLRLNAYGIAASTRSACASISDTGASAEAEGGSYVVRALGENIEIESKEQQIQPYSSVRFSLGRGTQKKDIERTVQVLHEISEKFE